MIDDVMKNWVIEKVLETVPDATMIILYGSRVVDPHHANPDIDIDIRAIVPEKALPKYDWDKFQREHQVRIDTLVLEEFGWDERAALKIDLKVLDWRDTTIPHKILWEGGRAVPDDDLYNEQADKRRKEQFKSNESFRQASASR